MSVPPNARKRLSREAILRAVASSTAIETGERIADIETRLRAAQGQVPNLSLALSRSAKPAPR